MMALPRRGAGTSWTFLDIRGHADRLLGRSAVDGPPAGGAGPDPRRAHTLAELARELELLRARAARGTHKTKISLAELAKRVDEPRSTVHSYVTGRYLAPLDVLDRIVTELGAGPAELREWSEAWFRVSAAQEVRKRAGTTPGDRAGIPRELPADVPAFTGRTAELHELDRLLANSAREPSAVVISAVAGTAGVGKTALAVHWGRAAAGSFPDGCLYVDLRGYDPDEPMHPGDALARFLRALGVAGADIPCEPTERAARYRTLLDGRRMLIVLDNARNTEQVRPLLPGTPCCFVIVTSRDRLAGLVSRHGARRIDLDVLPPADAAALLRTLVGSRVDTDPAAAGRLTAYCARLPLALRIAAELAAARPAMPLAELAGELADEHRKLDLLAAGDDRRTAVRTVFSWSYRHLSADAARLFRLLGLHPGTEITTEAAARLADIDTTRARRLLDTLAHAHLIQASTPNRYRMHDLLRAWARECATAEEAETDRRAALTRLFDHYLHTASATVTAADELSASRWLAAERANLLAVVVHAATSGWPRHAIELAATLHNPLVRIGDVTAVLTLHEHALAAAEHHGARTDQVRALHDLAVARSSAGQFTEAHQLLRHALALHRDIGDRAGEARALSNLGSLYWRSGRYALAAEHLRQAMAIFRDIGDLAGEARALMNLGATFWWSGDYEQSAQHFRKALARCEDIGRRDLQTIALSGLGAVHWRRGQYEQAANHLNRALAVATEIGNTFGESVALTHLGVVSGRIGDHRQATEELQRAVTLFGDMGDRDGQAEALTLLGDVYNLTARHELAATCHNEALRIYRACGNRRGLAMAWNGLGETACASGEPVRALRAHEQAGDHAGQLGDRLQLARAYRGTGHAQYLLGNLDQCRARWRHALALYEELGIPEAEEIRARLGDALVTRPR